MHLFDWAHRIDLRHEIQEIYLHRFLFQLALGTVSIFLPLYLYEHQVSPTGILLFFAVFYATFIGGAWPAAHLAARFGYKHTSFLASPFVFVFYLLLRNFSALPVGLYLVAVIGGVGFITYWIGMNSEMARSSHKDNRGKETGLFFSMPVMASIISPFLGGLVITIYGFSSLFLLAAAILAISFAPFLFSREHYTGLETDATAIFNRHHLTDFAAFFLRGITTVAKKIVWPLYLAIIITGALNIGGIGSIMAVGSVLLNIGLGARLTPANRGRVLAVGATLLAVTWLAMSLVTTPLQAFVVAFVNGLFYAATGLPLYTAVLDNAEREDIIEYMAFREIALCTGRVSLLLAFATLFAMLPLQSAFTAAFSLIAATTILIGVFGPLMDRS